MIELNPKAGDAEAVANFKYENKTDKPIQIKNVRSSCGCTVASLKKNDVAPGEKGEVTATFKIGGRTGAQQKTVTVETDDPKEPITNLVLKATIAETVEIKPNFVFWESGEDPKPKQITVKAASADVKMTKLDVTSSSPEFTTRGGKGVQAGRVRGQRDAERYEGPTFGHAHDQTGFSADLLCHGARDSTGLHRRRQLGA